MGSLVAEPLLRLGLGFGDVDKYATELHNPEITEPAASGDVPAQNYRLIAALAVLAKQIAREDMPQFVRQHGMPGFSPTQGHIASAVPLPRPRHRAYHGRRYAAGYVPRQGQSLSGAYDPHV